MINSDILLDEIDNIDKEMSIIFNSINTLLEIRNSFVNMGDFYSILEKNYEIFNDSINYVVDKMNKLNNYVYDNVISQYYSIYREFGSDLRYNYHKLNEISKENE